MSEEKPATKTCPACAEEIKAEAKKCKHCGKTQPEPLTPGLAIVGVIGALAIAAFVVMLIFKYAPACL